MVDKDGRWFWIALFAIAGAYVGGSAANDWQWNPSKWDWNNSKTWLGLGLGLLGGGGLGYAIEMGYLNFSLKFLYEGAEVGSIDVLSGHTSATIAGVTIAGGVSLATAGAIEIKNYKNGNIEDENGKNDFFFGYNEELYKASYGNNVSTNSSSNYLDDVINNLRMNTERVYYYAALAYEGVPYKYGGTDPSEGIDCSYLICLATGSSYRWTTNVGDPPGNWTRVNANTTSTTRFLNSVNEGDLFVWPGRHTAFYAGGNRLFHAHGSSGTPTGYTNDLVLYWLPNLGYPNVYRQYRRPWWLR